MRQNQVSRSVLRRDRTDRRDRQDRVDATLLERPYVRAVVDAVRRDGMPMPVAGQKDDVALGDLAEDQCGRRLPVGRANDLAVRNGERGEAGKHGFRRFLAITHRFLPEKPAWQAAQLLLCATLVILVNS